MKIKRVYALCYLVFLLAFTSCECAVEIRAREDGEQEFALQLELGKLVLEAANSIAQFSPSDGALFDTEAIKAQLERSRFKDVAVSSASPSQLTLMATGSLSALVSQTGTSLRVTLSPRSLAQAASLFPEEERAVFDLLMAPVFTGEPMTSEEYRELLALVYGNEFADEAARAAISFRLLSPKGKAKHFRLLLLDLLTLTGQRTLSIDF